MGPTYCLVVNLRARFHIPVKNFVDPSMKEIAPGTDQHNIKKKWNVSVSACVLLSASSVVGEILARAREGEEFDGRNHRPTGCRAGQSSPRCAAGLRFSQKPLQCHVFA